jgi:hypothetical protein
MIHATFPHAPKHFESMTEAFNFCREKGHPVTVCADGKILKLYPSGRADDTGQECPTELAIQEEEEREERINNGPFGLGS